MSSHGSLFDDWQPAFGPRRALWGKRSACRALVCSVAAHAAILAAVLVAVSRLAGPISDGGTGALVAQMLVWQGQPGPGGGGGGGGNRMQEPPRRMSVRGEDQMSMPAVEPLVLNPQEQPPTDAPSLDQQVIVPIQFAGASLETHPGTLDGVSGNSPSRGPGSGTGAGRGHGSGIGDGDGPGVGDGRGGGTGSGYYLPGSGVETPVPITIVKPNYTADAMRARIQGTAWVECVVLPDGGVARPRVTKSLDPVFGLDQEAIKAARQWRFRPGRRNGQAVPVLITIALDFTIS